MTLPTLLSLKPLITLLALVNPLAILPFYIHYTQSFSEEQRKRDRLNKQRDQLGLKRRR